MSARSYVQRCECEVGVAEPLLGWVIRSYEHGKLVFESQSHHYTSQRAAREALRESRAQARAAGL